jgi:hypothetical protein
LLSVWAPFTFLSATVQADEKPSQESSVVEGLRTATFVTENGKGTLGGNGSEKP